MITVFSPIRAGRVVHCLNHPLLVGVHWRDSDRERLLGGEGVINGDGPLLEKPRCSSHQNCSRSRRSRGWGRRRRREDTGHFPTWQNQVKRLFNVSPIKNKHFCVEGLRAIVKRRLLDHTEPFWVLMLLVNSQILL